MAALLGLIGVVVGAGATFAATYYFELRRERRDVAAARAVAGSEIGEALRAISDSLAGNKWAPGWQNKNWSESWSKYRPILAASMTEDEFQSIAAAYLEMELLQAGLAAGSRELTDPDKDFLNNASTRLLSCAIQSRVAD
jgi:hypothetical protein